MRAEPRHSSTNESGPDGLVAGQARHQHQLQEQSLGGGELCSNTSHWASSYQENNYEGLLQEVGGVELQRFHCQFLPKINPVDKFI